MHLIDTSIWIDFLNKKSAIELTQRVQTLVASKQAVWCPMIQLELQRAGKQRAAALALLNEVLPSLEMNQAVWQLAHQLAQACSRTGKPVPNTDILIYATALHHGCEVFHNDKHFDWLAKIATPQTQPLPE
jgi:predicted nucleic acid-binding protein